MMGPNATMGPSTTSRAASYPSNTTCTTCSVSSHSHCRVQQTTESTVSTGEQVNRHRSAMEVCSSHFFQLYLTVIISLGLQLDCLASFLT